MPDDYPDTDPSDGGDSGSTDSTPPSASSDTYVLPFTAHKKLAELYFPGWELQGDGKTLQRVGSGAAGIAAGSINALQRVSDAALKGDWKTLFNSLVGDFPATQGNLTTGRLKPIFDTLGFKLSPPNAAGQISKIQIPTGEWVRVIEGDPVAGGSWTWVPQGGGMGANGVDPSYLQPFGERFDDSLWRAPDFESPGDFKAPTKEDLYADPSYQFRFDEGRRGVELSALAKGLGGSGGTLVDLMNYGQNAASQEYQNVWNRGFGLWRSNWDNALSSYGAKFGTNNANWERAWKNFVERKDTWYRNQNEPFNKLHAMAWHLGAGAAGA
jgi:hypothetical protein